MKVAKVVDDVQGDLQEQLVMWHASTMASAIRRENSLQLVQADGVQDRVPEPAVIQRRRADPGPGCLPCSLPTSRRRPAQTGGNEAAQRGQRQVGADRAPASDRRGPGHLVDDGGHPQVVQHPPRRLRPRRSPYAGCARAGPAPCRASRLPAHRRPLLICEMILGWPSTWADSTQVAEVGVAPLLADDRCQMGNTLSAPADARTAARRSPRQLHRQRTPKPAEP